MRVLVSGGIKTQNIVNELNKKFTDGSIQFLVATNIDDIPDLYSKGEYFDRALIIEQCWTKDSHVTSEKAIRQQLYEFAEAEYRRGINSTDYVFLTRTEEMADIVFEETLRLSAKRAIVVKEPKYSVGFFVSLVSCELDEFPDSILYKGVMHMEEDDIDEDDNSIDGDLEEHDDFENIGLHEDSDKHSEFDEDEDEDLTEEDLTEEDLTEEDLTEEDLTEEDLTEEDLTEEDLEESIGFAESVNDSAENYVTFDEEQSDESEEHLHSEEQGDFEDISLYDNSEEHSEFDEDNEEGDEDTIHLSHELDEMGNDDDLYNKLFGKGEKLYGEGSKVEEADNLDLLEELYGKPENMNDCINGPDEIGIANGVELEEDSDKPSEISKEDEVSKFIDEVFSDEEYKTTDESDYEAYDTTEIKKALGVIASRGSSITITGCAGSGVSTIAYQLANTIVKMGFTVLLVDLDTENKTQSYISKQSFNSVGAENMHLLNALNDPNNLTRYADIVKPGFYLLTTGMAEDNIDIQKAINRQKVIRFVNNAKSSYNFVIYDVPFNTAIGAANDITYLADNILFVIDSSNWGVAKAMLTISNIEEEDMQDTVFDRAQLIFNKYRDKSNVLRKRIKNVSDIQKAMDETLTSLINSGEKINNFKSMRVCGCIPYNDEYERCWFSDRQYSDKAEGQQIYSELLRKIIFN